MGIFSKLFGGDKVQEVTNPVTVDMHSHLLPGIDDGVDSFDEAVEMVVQFQTLGYTKLITTPHIMADYYQNEPETIKQLCDELNGILTQKGIDVKVEAAAEYYLDENFLEMVKAKKLLSFGKNYILVETAFMEAANNFNECIFQAKLAGYNPVLAHPERYQYLYKSFEGFQQLYEKEILFAVNIGSLAGYYNPQAKKFAERLVKENMVDFLGSDAHHVRHLEPVKRGLLTAGYAEAVNSNRIRNNSL